MQTQSNPVDWAALDDYLTRGAKAPVLSGLSFEGLVAGGSACDTRDSGDVSMRLPITIEPELVRWAGMPF